MGHLFQAVAKIRHMWRNSFCCSVNSREFKSHAQVKETLLFLKPDADFAEEGTAKADTKPAVEDVEDVNHKAKKQKVSSFWL